ncbi:MAG: enoyl-CoA hydratase/isomerase family protein [Novosphingobium sp.]
MQPGIEALTVDPAHLWRGEPAPDLPLVLINLDAAGDCPDDIELPPCAVIGYGNAGHPLASRLDAVIEAGFQAEQIATQVLAAPLAAAATVQLLRLLPALDREAGLTAESLAYAMLQGSGEHRRWLAGRGAVGVREQPGRVRLERGGRRLTITLDSPEAGNAIDRATRDQLYEAFALAALDAEITGVSLRANGKAFSLGAELSEFGTTTDPAGAHAIRWRTLPARQAARCADKLDVHVHGACVGAGLELAGFAHRITATSGAWFQLPELAMGILPGAGGCVSLSRRIGRQRAALLMLSGRRLSARRALEWRLVDAIVDEPA